MSSTHEPSGDDPLRPSAKEASAVLKKSQRHWGALLACARAADSLPASCANIHSLLHETPALPGADVDVEEIVDSKKESLDLVGYSVWGLGSTKCDLSNETKSSRAVEVQIGTSEPQFCTLSTEATLQWTGFQGFRAQRKTGNYLCALVLGWSYVLSARLVELRRKSGNDRITYTEAQAPLITGEQPFSEGDGVAISVGKADPGACRWWAAVLAGGCGWKAVLHRSGHDFHAPWACHLKFNNDEQIKFYHSPSTDSSSFATAKPPSSTQALQHLMDFAKLHDVVDQLLAAFAGALTLPPRQRYGAPVVLPQLVAALPKKEKIRVTLARLLPSASDLPHFMAFSCVSMAVFSCLGSSLWQPGIACNLVSEWLYPIWQQALPELRREKRSDIIVRMMAMRRPSVAPLWLGSAITGSLPIFLDYHNGYGGPILLETVEWAKAPQSFMDPGYHRKAPVKVEKGQKYICREDEMRLLYISNRQSSQYQHLPLVPFPPIGSSRIKSTAIEDRSSASSSLELLAHESGDGNGSLALDLESKFGKSALSSGSSRIPTAAEIREKKERRARLAKEQAANAHNNNEDDFIPLEDYDSDGEFKPRRMQVGSYIPHQTEKDTRLVRDDEDFAEGFDEFVEDTGRVSLLSRKAQREQALKEREAIRSMINEAEGGDSLSDGSGGDGSGDDESDTEYERHQLYESAQTHRAMDGLPAHAEHTRQINRPRQPRHTTPIPKLSVGLARLRDMVSSLEFERARIQKRRADILREKAEIKASQEHIQTSLEEAGRELERVTKEHLEKAKTAAANGTTTAVPSAAGNGNGNGNTTPNININAGSGSGHNGNGQSLLQSQSTAATTERGLESFGNTPGNTA
ncbi:hypothetical protein KCU88_g3774, partial [Aureobasidium melanogenum]